jgi:hypothetical protein
MVGLPAYTHRFSLLLFNETLQSVYFSVCTVTQNAALASNEASKALYRASPSASGVSGRDNELDTPDAPLA